ncbi:unnamed protein product [Ilex paraguariensis]|uniref:Uncharacterized protein n=1 Tax=Ilex paraguariensis TaxID=185542 RepID=A0ABC8TX58_9AQUA
MGISDNLTTIQMAGTRNSLAVFLVLLFLLLSSLLFDGEARPLNAPTVAHSSVEEPIMNILNRLNVEAIKTGGPGVGQGHKFTNAQPVGEIKNSGPSPGEGH